jgi:hypothetical protein
MLLLHSASTTGLRLGSMPHLQPGGQRGVPSSYKQSCAFNPACVAGKEAKNLLAKQRKYAPLGGNKKPALVTPQLGISR